MSAELFSYEGFHFLIVNVVDGVVRELFVIANCYDVEWCGRGMLWRCDGIGYVVNRSFCDSEGLVCGTVSVEYDVGTCFGMSACVTCACHVGWTRVEDGVGPLDSLRCRVFARSGCMVLKVSMHVRS